MWMTVVAAAQDDDELSGFRRPVLGQIRQQVEHLLRFIDDRDGKSNDEYKTFVTRTVRETVFAT